MRILDRYLVREFVNYTLLGFSTFVAIFVIVDLTERIDTFVDNHTPPLVVLEYYLRGLPTIVTQVLPIATLLGALVGLSQLRKHNELTAMQGSGESPWRLARPLLLAGFIISLAQYALNESIVPSFYSEQKRILTEDIKRQSVADRQSRSGIRLLGSGGRFFVAQFFDARASQLRQVSVQVKDGPILLERIDAKLARYQEGDWIFEDGVIRVFGDSTESAARFRRYATSEVTEVPLDFARTDEDPFHMSMRSLLAFARRLEEYGGETQKHMTNFHIRASFPLANLIMVLLGAALSLRIVRGSPVALGIGLSVSIGFAYFAFIRMGQALGYNGTLPPVVAAWLANVVFAVIGLFLFRKIAR